MDKYLGSTEYNHKHKEISSCQQQQQHQSEAETTIGISDRAIERPIGASGSDLPKFGQFVVMIQLREHRTLFPC